MNICIDYRTLGQKIREKRKEAGLTQDQLAEAAEISSVHLSHIESGTTRLSLSVFFRIKKALDISADWLLDEL